MLGYPFECLKFVWRQSGFAFFGALTSVGALFYYGVNMKYDREYLNLTNVHALRNIAREIGVRAPCSLKKQVLVDEIMLIESGKKEPHKKSNKGRPVKNGGQNINHLSGVNLIAMKKEIKKEIISNILRHMEKKLNEIL